MSQQEAEIDKIMQKAGISVDPRNFNEKEIDQIMQKMGMPISPSESVVPHGTPSPAITMDPIGNRFRSIAESLGPSFENAEETLGAAARGAKQYNTYNFGDELVAFAQSLKEDPIGALRKLATKKAVGPLAEVSDEPNKEFNKIYEQKLAGESAADKEAAEKHPLAFHGTGIASAALLPTNILGATGKSVKTAAEAAKATLAARAANAIKGAVPMAAEGALYGAGAAEGDAKLRDVASGVALGGVAKIFPKATAGAIGGSMIADDRNQLAGAIGGAAALSAIGNPTTTIGIVGKASQLPREAVERGLYRLLGKAVPDELIGSVSMKPSGSKYMSELQSLLDKSEMGKKYNIFEEAQKAIKDFEWTPLSDVMNDTTQKDSFLSAIQTSLKMRSKNAYDVSKERLAREIGEQLQNNPGLARLPVRDFIKTSVKMTPAQGYRTASTTTSILDPTRHDEEALQARDIIGKIVRDVDLGTRNENLELTTQYGPEATRKAGLGGLVFDLMQQEKLKAPIEKPFNQAEAQARALEAQKAINDIAKGRKAANTLASGGGAYLLGTGHGVKSLFAGAPIGIDQLGNLGKFLERKSGEWANKSSWEKLSQSNNKTVSTLANWVLEDLSEKGLAARALVVIGLPEFQQAIEKLPQSESIQR